MVDERKTVDSSLASSPIQVEDVVELKPGPDGIYEPASGVCDGATRQTRADRRKAARKPVPSEDVESQVITGFKLGMSVVRKVGRALNIKI